MKARLSRSLPLSILLLGLCFGVSATPKQIENQSSTRFARIILFVPDDAEVPEGYQQRLHDIAIRTENFFADGIEQWGWDVARQDIFGRNPSGDIEVTVVRSALPLDATLNAIMPRAIEGATNALGQEAVENAVWWVFYHTPVRAITGFRGGGDRDGGRAINSYPTVEGEISPTVELAAPEMWPLKLKGSLHEFGHALGLPHIGPNPSAGLGNTLMGPINNAYANRLPEGTTEPRVYLSPASATLLAKHPLFVSQGPISSAGEEPIEVANLVIEETANNTIEIRGIITGPAKAHSVVALDSDSRFGDYWSRNYTSTVGDQGDFLITLGEPFDSSKGFLKLYVCLEDGRNKATGTSGVIEIQYEGNPGERIFPLFPANASALSPSTDFSSTPNISLINISVRARAGGIAGTPVTGFVINGTGNKPTVIRAVGPGLSEFGVSGVLANPQFSLISNSTVIAANTQWDSTDATAFTTVGAFPLTAGSADAAIVTSLPAGAYTAPVDPGAAAGVALLEVYDAAIDDQSAQLVNASTRAYVGTGDDILVPGFVVYGEGQARLLIRAVGPSLNAFGVLDTLTNPRITLFCNGDIIATNEDWESAGTNIADASAVVGAFALAEGSLDAALLVSLEAGNYTVAVEGNAPAPTGTVLFEIYLAPAPE